MGLDWKPLTTELGIWRTEGLTLPIWWRDDDAVEPTSQLDQLANLAASTGVPVHLAVIPQGAARALADALKDRPGLVPVVHGYAHRNHAPEGSKKSEFGATRAVELATADIRTGLEQMQRLFGANLTPMFVPPWNRFAPALLPELERASYQAISTFNPRRNRFAVGKLEQINTHIDPIDWHGGRSVHPADMLVDHTVSLLRNRRLKLQDNTEPLGLLTHHLVHDRAIWDFTAEFIEILLAGPVRIWTARDQIQGTLT
ncbi:MAG: polysaccharide deacetylase [Rhodobacteraceae bacterium]|nr:polysaccharide deacetylase [Paracoccaceae bacterium]